MAKYSVFESTNMASTKYAERIFDAVATVDIENGTFGYLDGLATDETVIYNFVAGTKAGEQVVVADNPAWTEDECRKTNQRKDKYIIPAGTPFRVRVVKVNDEFAINKEGFVADTTDANLVASTKTAPKMVTIDATGKLAVAASAADGAVMVGELMRVRQVGGVIKTTAHDYGYTRKMYEVKVKSLA